MATLQIADLEPTLREIVFPSVTKQFPEDETYLRDRIGDGKGDRINGRGVRIPLYMAPNASNAHFAEAGALPTPGKTVDIESKVFPTRYGKGFEMSGDWFETSDSPEALIKGMTGMLGRTYQSAKMYLDQVAFGDGTGIIGTVFVATTSGTPGAFTCTTLFANGLTIGSRNILENALIDFTSSAGVARSNNPSTVTTKDDSIFNVNVGTLDASVAATDVITYANSYNKAAHGVAYAINNDTGNFQGVSRTTWPKTRGGVLNAGGQAISQVLVQKARTAIRVRTGKTANNVVMVSHPAQKESFMRQGYTLQRFAGKGETFDPSFKDAKSGGEWQESINCWDDRVYFLNFSTIKKYTLKDFGPYNADGLTFRMFFSNGAASDKWTGWVGCKEEYGYIYPAANEVLKNLSVTDLSTGTASWS